MGFGFWNDETTEERDKRIRVAYDNAYKKMVQHRPMRYRKDIRECIFYPIIPRFYTGRAQAYSQVIAHEHLERLCGLSRAQNFSMFDKHKGGKFFLYSSSYYVLGVEVLYMSNQFYYFNAAYYKSCKRVRHKHVLAAVVFARLKYFARWCKYWTTSPLMMMWKKIKRLSKFAIKYSTKRRDERFNRDFRLTMSMKIFYPTPFGLLEFISRPSKTRIKINQL